MPSRLSAFASNKPDASGTGAPDAARGPHAANVVEALEQIRLREEDRARAKRAGGDESPPRPPPTTADELVAPSDAPHDVSDGAVGPGTRGPGS